MIVRELLTKFGFKADVAAVEKFKSAVDGAKKAADTLTVAVGKTAKETQGAMKDTSTDVNKVKEAFLGAAKAVAAVKAAIVGVPGEVTAAEERVSVFNRVLTTAKVKADELAASLRKAFSAGPGHGSAPGVPGKPSGGGHGGGMGGLMGHLGMLGAGYMGFQAGEVAIEHYGEFQQNIQKAAAAMAAGSNDMVALHESIKAMSKKALDIAQTLGFNPRQVSESMMEIGSKGFDAKDVMQITPTALKLARAGMADPKLATELLTSSIEGFYGRDKGAAKHEEVGDLLVAAHDAGGVSLADMKESNKYLAPAAGAMGQSMKDMMGMTALLGRFGMTGSMAGNGLKSMLIKLAAPSEMSSAKLSHIKGYEDAPDLIEGKLGKHGKRGAAKGKKETELARLHIDPLDAKRNMRSMIDIMHDVVKKTSKMGTGDRAAVFKNLFGLEDIPQGMAIARAMSEDNGKAFTEVMDRMNKSHGAMDRMNKVMNEGLTPAWQRVTAKAEVLAVMLIEKMAPSMVAVLDAVSGLIDGAIELTKWFDDVTDGGKKLEPAMQVVRAALVALLPFLTAWMGLMLASKIKLAATAALEFAKSMWAIAVGTDAAAVASRAFLMSVAWWGILIAAVAAVILVLQDLYTWLDGGDSALGSFWQWWADIFDELKAGIAPLQDLQDALTNLMAAVMMAFDGTGDSTNLDAFYESLSAAWDKVFGGLGDALVGMWNDMVGKLIETWNGFVDYLTGVWQDVVGMWNNALGSLSEAWDGFTQAVSSGLDSVKNMFTEAFDYISGIITTAISGAVDQVGGLANGIADVLSKIPGLGNIGGAAGGGTWGTNALSGVTPGASPAAGGGTNNTIVHAGAHIKVVVGPGAKPAETARAIHDAHGAHVEKVVRNVMRSTASLHPKQLR